jgi:hypothetical protein
LPGAEKIGCESNQQHDIDPDDGIKSVAEKHRARQTNAKGYAHPLVFPPTRKRHGKVFAQPDERQNKKNCGKQPRRAPTDQQHQQRYTDRRGRES